LHRERGLDTGYSRDGGGDRGPNHSGQGPGPQGHQAVQGDPEPRPQCGGDADLHPGEARAMEKPAVNLGWRKSSYSANGGAQCVEVAAIPWRKSTHSANGGAECVEAGHVPGAVLVRDTTQHGTGPVLRVTPRDWTRFNGALRVNAPLR